MSTMSSMWGSGINFKSFILSSVLLLWANLLTMDVRAQDDVYQKPSAFVSKTFGGKIPKAGAITLTKARQAEIKR